MPWAVSSSGRVKRSSVSLFVAALRHWRGLNHRVHGRVLEVTCNSRCSLSKTAEHAHSRRICNMRRTEPNTKNKSSRPWAPALGLTELAHRAGRRSGPALGRSRMCAPAGCSPRSAPTVPEDRKVRHCLSTKAGETQGKGSVLRFHHRPNYRYCLPNRSWIPRLRLLASRDSAAS